MQLPSRLNRAARRWRTREAGVAEATTAIFVLPIIAALIFVLLEAGTYMHYRNRVDGIVADVVRASAMEGGWNNPRTHMVVAGNPDWITFGRAKLQEVCGTSRCSSTPTFTCTTPAYVSNVGDPVTCTGTFYYKPVSPMGSSVAFSFGMSTIFKAPIVVTITASSSVGTT